MLWASSDIVPASTHPSMLQEERLCSSLHMVINTVLFQQFHNCCFQPLLGILKMFTFAIITTAA